MCRKPCSIFKMSLEQRLHAVRSSAQSQFDMGNGGLPCQWLRGLERAALQLINTAVEPSDSQGL
jgi:hypothetical protein